MKYKSFSKNSFFEWIENKKIICVGASKHLYNFYNNHEDKDWINSIIGIVDNYCSSEEYCLGDKKWTVSSLDSIKSVTDTVILITPLKKDVLKELINQLDSMRLDDSNTCLCFWHIENYKRNDNSQIENAKLGSEEKIPRIIHSFWFSKDRKPQNYIDCIDSWKKYCPDFEIKEWNLDTYDINSSRFFREAIECRAWAYASDYARLDVVHKMGGIYLDMDVEILKPIDELLKFKGFFSKDIWGNIDLGSGFGACKGDKFVEELLNSYANSGYERYGKGNENNELTPQPTRLFDKFRDFGVDGTTNSQLINGLGFLSPDYIRVIEDPSHGREAIEGEEYAIHWHNAGWFTEDERNKRDATVSEIRNFRLWIDSYFGR